MHNTARNVAIPHEVKRTRRSRPILCIACVEKEGEGVKKKGRKEGEEGGEERKEE